MKNCGKFDLLIIIDEFRANDDLWIDVENSIYQH